MRLVRFRSCLYRVADRGTMRRNDFHKQEAQIRIYASNLLANLCAKFDA
jgi:hypothetical protein